MILEACLAYRLENRHLISGRDVDFLPSGFESSYIGAGGGQVRCVKSPIKKVSAR